MYHLVTVAIDVDETVQPPWITLRVVEGGSTRGGMTQYKGDFVPPYAMDELSNAFLVVENLVCSHIAGIEGVQLTL